MYYECSVCKRHYSSAEVIKYYDEKVQKFVCHGQPLEEKTEQTLPFAELERKKKKLNEQLDPLQQIIKEIQPMKVAKHIVSLNDSLLKPYTYQPRIKMEVQEGKTKSYSFKDGETPVTIHIIDQDAEAEKRKEEET